jgi:catechol 2,3-dioxygenase-like lactoylglutathione lyase family enzyme
LITGLHHFALTVADMERSKSFYAGLGLDVVADREVSGGYVEEITGIKGAEVRVVLLSGFGHALELIEYRRPRGERRARPFQDAGSAHVCVLTENLDVAVEQLHERGVQFRSSEPVSVASGPNRGRRAIYAEDPDGNAVELVESAS